MKKSLWTITIVLSALFITSQIVIGCGGKKEQSAEEHEHAEGDTTNHHHDEMEMDSTEMDHDQMAYACPMHPEVTGKEGDTCSKCGMKLEPVKGSDSTDMHDH